MWLEAQATISLLMLPVEEALIGAAGIAVKEAAAIPKAERVTSKASILARNVAKGKSYEKKGIEQFISEGETELAEQVTVKAENGIKTRIDLMSLDTEGNLVLTEMKSSATAPLTKNQKQAFPSIEESGGIIVGKGKPGYEGGTKIPPTKVRILRPRKFDDPAEFEVTDRP